MGAGPSGGGERASARLSRSAEVLARRCPGPALESPARSAPGRHRRHRDRARRQAHRLEPPGPSDGLCPGRLCGRRRRAGSGGARHHLHRHLAGRGTAPRRLYAARSPRDRGRGGAGGGRQMRALLARPDRGRPSRPGGTLRALHRCSCGASRGDSRMKPLHRLGIGCAALVIILDQLSKPLMRDWLSGGDIYVAPFFNLVSAWNKGVGFSLMTMHGDSGPYLLSGLAIEPWPATTSSPSAGMSRSSGRSATAGSTGRNTSSPRSGRPATGRRFSSRPRRSASTAPTPTRSSTSRVPPVRITSPSSVASGSRPPSRWPSSASGGPSCESASSWPPGKGPSPS